MSQYEDLQKLLEATKDDFDKFYVKQVAKAGSRLRKSLKAVADKIKEIRKDVSTSKRQLKAERKAAKAPAAPTASST